MNEADNLMRDLMAKAKTTQSVADFFVIKFRGLQYQLSKIVDRFFYENNQESKSICINLICEMLKKSAEKNIAKTFVKGFAQRLRFCLQDLSRNYVSEGIALSIVRNIEALRLKGIFYDQYFDKLHGLAKKIKQNSNGQNINLSKSFENQQQKRYSKTFLTKYKVVCENSQFQAIYETYLQFSKLQIDLDGVGKEGQSNSFDTFTGFSESEKSFGHEIKKSLTSATGQRPQEKKLKLEKMICQIHSHIFSLQRLMREQLNRLEQNIQTGMQRIESQYSIMEE